MNKPQLGIPQPTNTEHAVTVDQTRPDESSLGSAFRARCETEQCRWQTKSWNSRGAAEAVASMHSDYHAGRWE